MANDKIMNTMPVKDADTGDIYFYDHQKLMKGVPACLSVLGKISSQHLAHLDADFRNLVLAAPALYQSLTRDAQTLNEVLSDVIDRLALYPEQANFLEAVKLVQDDREKDALRSLALANMGYEEYIKTLQKQSREYLAKDKKS